MMAERVGTPFKRRAMENDVGFYSIYAFTSSMARVVVKKHWKLYIILQKVLKHIEKRVNTLKNQF